MNLSIRKAESRDIEIIARNVRAMAFDGSGIKLCADTVRQGVHSLFEQPELGFYIVAEIDGKIIGSLVIVFEWSDWRNGVHWWIHSVYVHPDYRRKGVYRRMYEYVKDQARSNPEVVSLNLSVNKNNKVARTAYENIGMAESNSVIYHAPDL